MEEIIHKRILCPSRGLIEDPMIAQSEPGIVSFSNFVNDSLEDIRAVRLILAISVAVKTISSMLRKKALTARHVLGFLSDEVEITELEISTEIFLQCIKDTRVVWQVSCPLYKKVLTFSEYKDAEYIVNFTANDGPQGHMMGTATLSSAFSIMKKIPNDTDEDTNHTLQIGKNILYSGYAIYGPGTVFYLTLKENRVDGFLLDRIVGEFVILDKNIKIPENGPIYTINEGLSFHYPQKVLDWLQEKKNPKNFLGAKCRCINSKMADIHRILKKGGIYCHPRSDVLSTAFPHKLVFECQAISHLITQAGGLATDGKSWMLDVVPSSQHCMTPLFIGSPSEVFLLLKHIRPSMLIGGLSETMSDDQNDTNGKYQSYKMLVD